MKKSYAKYANWYDLNGDIINHVKADGRIHDLTVEEVEALVDKLADEKDENGNIKRKQEFDNASAVLFHMYNKYGNPHEKDIIEAVKEAAKRKTNTSEVQTALKEIGGELAKNAAGNVPTASEDKPDNGEYVEYEQVA